MKWRLRLIAGGMVLLVPLVSNADYKNVRSVDYFNRQLTRAKYPLVVAAFFDRDKKQMSKEDVKQAKEFRSMVRSVAKKDRYDDADVLFLTVNISKGDTARLLERYGITAVPTTMLFFKGAPYKDVRKVGYLTPYSLEDFVEDNFGDVINDILHAKAEERARRAYYRSLYAPYWGYWGWGAPYYYGYPYYYGGPHVRFGVGVGW